MKKNTMILIISATIVLIVGCTKNGMMGDELDVDIKKYEATLNLDYHNASHALSSDPAYYKMMFNTNDSLFSEHFYDFCTDMMNNSGMMNTTGGMMGNNSNMMGQSSGMMNGSAMGSQADMIQMMNYMDSIHVLSNTIMDYGYMKTDSLIYNQMSMCKMMTSRTEGITRILDNMQILRKNHKTLHRN